jgi:hypothetical protein
LEVVGHKVSLGKKSISIVLAFSKSVNRALQAWKEYGNDESGAIELKAKS